MVRDGLASAPQLPAHDHGDPERDRDGKEDASEGKDTTSGCMRFASQMQNAWGLHLPVELVHHGGAGDRKVRGEVGVAVIHVEAVEHGEDLIDHRRIGLSTTISRILREECNPGASDIVAAHEEDNEECPGR